MKKDIEIKKTIQVYEKLAEHYHNTHQNIENIQYILNYFTKKLEWPNILDIGCGPWRDAKYFTENGLNVKWIDLSNNLLKIARKEVPKARFLQMDMRTLNFPEKSFDGIWACASFTHLPKKDAKKTLTWFHKILKPNWLIYISVKWGSSEEKFITKESYLGNNKFFSFYNKEEFENLIKSCCFQILKTSIDKWENLWINIFAKKERISIE